MAAHSITTGTKDLTSRQRYSLDRHNRVLLTVGYHMACMSTADASFILVVLCFLLKVSVLTYLNMVKWTLNNVKTVPNLLSLWSTNNRVWVRRGIKCFWLNVCCNYKFLWVCQISRRRKITSNISFNVFLQSDVCKGVKWKYIDPSECHSISLIIMQHRNYRFLKRCLNLYGNTLFNSITCTSCIGCTGVFYW